MTEVSRTLEKLYKEYCVCDGVIVGLRNELENAVTSAMQAWEQKEKQYEQNCRQLSNYLGVADFVDVRYELMRCMKEHDLNGVQTLCPDSAPFNAGALVMASASPALRVPEVKRQVRGIIEQWIYDKGICDEEIRYLKSKTHENVAEQEMKKQQIKQQMERIMSEPAVVSAAETADNDKRRFCDGPALPLGELGLGRYMVDLDVTGDVKRLLPNCRLEVPVTYKADMSRGCVIKACYSGTSEEILFGGIRRFVLNTYMLLGGAPFKIFAIDCGRYTDDILGQLSPLAKGKHAAVKLAESENEAKILLQDVMGIIQRGEEQALCIVHNYSNCRSRETLSQIARSAAENNVVLLLTENINAKTSVFADVLTEISHREICCDSSGFYIIADERRCSFEWYPNVEKLSENVLAKLNTKKKDNEFTNWVGDPAKENDWVYSYPKKGNRRLENIPVGLDMDTDEQSKVTISLEDEKFASFIVGASRSGKSTLLQTILSSVIRDHHPDDVEIWLVDFAMTEFNPYIENCPPHIRYVIIDNSPQLICDFIDRLVDVMEKRSVIFKRNGWEKLGSVPKERYMPSILVVVDEFAEMSDVLTREDSYREKLEKLLRMGAKYGFHFIFSSQTFTTGTRGLTATAKAQIQLRIAMKCMEVSEVKETLTVRGLSDHDNQLIESLVPHYALIKDNSRKDVAGNQLTHAHVLYFKGETDDLRYRAYSELKTSDKLAAAERYEPEDSGKYIYKRPEFFDGTKYTAFDFRKDDAKTEIQLINDAIDYEPAPLQIMLGDPVRLKNFYTIPLTNGVGQNILMCAPIQNRTAAASVLCTVKQTLRFQGIRHMEVWCLQDAALYPVLDGIFGFRCKVGLEEIKVGLKRLGEQQWFDPAVVVVLEPNRILEELGAEEKDEGSSARAAVYYEKTLDQLIAEAEKKKTGETKEKAPEPVEKPAVKDDFDAVAAFKKLLKKGPKQGIHFCCVFDDLYWFKGTGLDSDMFRHKVLFRGDYSDYDVPSKDSRAAAALPEQSFIYTNRLERMTFRPYTHENLSLNNARDVSDDVYLL
ncbi:MAG: hypothetical protein IJ017_01280 [Oscillospiraceae bacterium]|nr:hypothetical protein [Oscillospiraceae bacterium]